MPETPLGPAGDYTGTTTYTKIDGRFYEAVTEGKGPAGPFKTRELIAYHKENKTVARQITDSRGLSRLEFGPVGGDLGGIYNLHLRERAVHGRQENDPREEHAALDVAAQLPRGEQHLGGWWAVHQPRESVVAEKPVTVASCQLPVISCIFVNWQLDTG